MKVETYITSHWHKGICGFGAVFTDEEGSFLAENSGHRPDEENLNELGGMVYAVIASVYGADRIGATELTMHCQNNEMIDTIIENPENELLLKQLHGYLDKMSEKMQILFEWDNKAEKSKPYFVKADFLSKSEAMRLLHKFEGKENER